MQGMRDVLKGSLARSLRAFDEVDRLAAAWPVVCGKATAERAVVAGYADGIVLLEAVNEAWMHEMMNMRGRLTRELARIAGVPVKDIRIAIKRNSRR